MNATNCPTILDLFKEWNSIRDQVNHDKPEPATEDRLYVELYALEKHILALPSVTASDLAAKFQVITDCGGFDSWEFVEECHKVLHHATRGTAIAINREA